MPRAPTYDMPQVETRALPTPRAADPGTSGLAGFGAALEQTGDRAVGLLDANARRARDQANAVQVTNADTKVQHAAGALFYDPEKGLLHKRGDEAFAAAKETWEEFEKARNAAAAEISDPHARAVFEARANATGESLKRQADGHLAQQRLVMQEESANATVAVGLNNIGARLYADPTGAELDKEVARMTSAVSALALTPEGRAARVAETREKAYAAAVNGRIGAGDLEGATAMLAAHRGDLGDVSDELELRIAVKKKAADEAAEKAKVKAVMDEVFVQLNTSRAVTPKLAARAAVEAPKEWFELQRQLAADRRTRAHEGSEERRLQHELDGMALDEFKAKALEDPDTAAKLDLASAFPDASPRALKRIGVEQARAKKTVEKGDDVPLAEFNKDVTAGTAGLSKPIAVKLKSAMAQWWSEYLDAHKGQKPSRDEALDAIGKWLVKGDKGGFLPSVDRYQGEIEEGDKFVPFDEEDQTNDFAKRAVRKSKGGGKPEAPAAAAPPPSAAAAAPAAPPKPSKKDRALSLIKAGKSNSEIAVILSAEYP